MNSVNDEARVGGFAGSGSVGGLPAVIDGLDLQQLRLRLGAAYDGMGPVLRQFLLDFGSWREQFDLAQREQDVDAMVRLAHTLKGTAANVCANQVQLAAQVLESALRQGGGQTAGLLQDCDAALQRLLTALRQLIQPEAAQESAPMVPEHAIRVVQEVMALLERRRNVPYTLQQDLRVVVAPVVSAEELEALLRQLASFEFKKSQQTLADIMSRLPT